MKKTLLTLSSAAIMLGGLTGCAAGNQATGNPGTDNRTENTRPIGYYTSENNPYATNVNNRTNRYTDHSGNAYELRDNDGPIIEMMDRAIINGDRNAQRNNTLTNRTGNNDRGLFNVTNRGQNQANRGLFNDTTTRTRTQNDTGMFNRNRNQNDAGLFNVTNRNNNQNIGFNNRYTPRANEGRGLFNVNTRNDQYADTNYHRHLNSTASRGKPSYYNNYQGELTEQIAARASRVRGVRDVRAVVYGNDVLVAVDTEANASETQVTRDVRRAVDPLVRNSDVRVVTDEGTFNRVRNVDNDIRDGGPMERLNEDIRSLFQTVTPGR
ncbi:hypothetical protein BC6307_16180 [Sutcliffiella cohnii]|uniref:Spore cortex protein n=1 Tax=Sutcliffiella cohnii TaxID=33932 RepID=A0A223KTC9_9BACI|nr:YhcN/YlaJ family sporulation lipoprotein [Sutcliffiella cohnii]AST92716.1 hypothetical protein BC6307_16180 [Sutcliffiella cohnii]